MVSLLRFAVNNLCRRSYSAIAYVNMAEAPSAKRSKTENDSETEDGADTVIGSNSDEDIKQRILRRKCIILLSYCGKGYMGMQRNPGVPTIEDELLKALAKAGAIREDLMNNPGKLVFQRCARTDKGVSAARQVVSIKMVPDPGLIPSINQNLPEQIRVVGIKKVTKSFNSQHACTSRIYEYVLPTYAFAPFKETNLKYRISATVITRVQKLLNVYIGTHNFHNFTAQKKYDDPSAYRYIMSFSVGHPFVRGDVEFISLSVEGQSFMLHQIRKMIGYIIAVVRDYITDDMVSEAFNKPKIDIPRAPALGLLLDCVSYNRYNLKYGDDGVHEKLDWVEYEDAITLFKERYIYKVIIDTEIRELSMLRWLETLQLHDFHQTKQRLTEQTQLQMTDQPTIEKNTSPNNEKDTSPNNEKDTSPTITTTDQICSATEDQ